MRHLVFVSYAREDRERIGPMLRALEAKDRPFDVFVDTKVPTAADWDKEIRSKLDAASIVLMFVSPDWEAKEYCAWERKRALERHDRDPAVPDHRLPRVVPIHLDIVHVPKIPGEDSLFRFKSPWDPKRALTEVLDGELAWKRAAAELVAEVLQILKDLPVASPAPALRPVATTPRRATFTPPPPFHTSPAHHRPRLDLHVERDGTKLIWTAHDHDRNLLRGSWQGRLADLLLAGRWRQELVAGRVSAGEIGDRLGEALLNEAPPAWCMDTTHGLLGALRALILTADPVLSTLPWRWTRDNGDWLLSRGWTFEIAPAPPTLSVTFEPVVRPLLVLPRCAGPDPGDHASGITGLLEQHFNAGHGVEPTLVRSAVDLRRALDDVLPRLVYVLARSAADGSGIMLDEDEGEVIVPLDRLRRSALETPLMLLLAVGAPLPPGPHLPLTLITHTLPLTAAEARVAGHAVLHALAFRELDPALAVEQACSDEPGWATAGLMVHTRVHAWETSRPKGPKLDSDAVVRLLDRDRQRRDATDYVYQLVRREVRARILVLIGLSGLAPLHPKEQEEDQDEPNALLPAALRDTIYSHVQNRVHGTAELRPVPMPYRRHEDVAGHVSAIETHLLPDPGETVGEHVAQLAGPLHEDLGRVLWLDAGVVCVGCTGDAHQHPATHEHIAAWAQAVQHVLGGRLLEPRLAVVWLTVISEDPDTTFGALRDLRLQPAGAAHADVQVLDPIEHLDRRHIVSFLRERASGFEGDVGAVADRIYQRYHGRFGPTARLLRRGMTSRWSEYRSVRR
jgi:hypothetical protein